MTTRDMRSIVVVALAVVLAFAAGVGVGALITREPETSRGAEVLTREAVLDAFEGEEIGLRRHFAAAVGLVDAAYTIANEQPPDKAPLVVEVLRTIPAAAERERFLIREAPEARMSLTVLRSNNVVAVVFGRRADLLRRVQSAMRGLE